MVADRSGEHGERRPGRERVGERGVEAERVGERRELLGIEVEGALAEHERPALRLQPTDRQLGHRAAPEHEVRVRRHAVEQRREDGPGLGPVEQVRVVDDERNRLRCPEHEEVDEIDDGARGVGDPGERSTQAGDEVLGITILGRHLEPDIVSGRVEGVLGEGLGEQGGLAVPGPGHHDREAVVEALVDPFDQARAAHEAGS